MHQQKKIMVIDDDPRIVKALALRLEAAGHKTVTTYNGDTGLLLARLNKPDLIITDIWMPVGSGLSMAFRLNEILPGIPIIFLTASKQPGLEEKAKKLGAAGYLEKPYDPVALLELVAQLLANNAPAQEPEELAEAMAN